ncbi:MAG: DNA repair and recombination protein RadA [Candidatus Heimdallarchaeota archaeon]
MIDQKILELPGVGPSTARRLFDAGFGTIESIAVASIGELSAIADIGEKTAGKIVEAARGVLNFSYEWASVCDERRMNIDKITTGSKSLNEVLGGGIETGSLTEFFGEFRTGKTQLAHQITVNVQLPREQGGLDGAALWIDTENTFRTERLKSMADKVKLDRQEVLDSILVVDAYNSDHQMLLAEQGPADFRKLAQEAGLNKGLRLIVVDSLTSYFRAEYVGRGTLAPRQQKLNKHVHTLLKHAKALNLAIVVTNQVMAKPEMMFGDPTAPIGGHVVAHAVQTRVYLRKSKGQNRIARVIDSPHLPESEAAFKITTAGIEDI